MAFAISRQIKLRSVEQAVFSPAYNRLNFFIQPDGLSTDLSQSYLSMRVYLTHRIDGERLSNADLQALLYANLVISFGNGEQSYSPACLLRTARLFANKGNELLEEVNFCNVLTQSIMHQLCNDFETIESTNLLTGSTTQFGHGSSISASLGAFLQNPTEVHIFLRDIFGICRHSNFELAATDGLNLTIELEDKQNLFRVSTLGDFQRINTLDTSGNTATSVLPENFLYPPASGYEQNSNTLSHTPVAYSQNVGAASNLFRDASGNSMIQYPKEGFWYPSDSWFQQPTQGNLIDKVTIINPYTTEQLTALGFIENNWMKLRYEISNSFAGATNIAPKIFSFMAQIGVVAGGATPIIPFNVNYSLWWDDVPGMTVDSLVHFVGLEILYEPEVLMLNAGTSTATIATLLASNSLTITSALYTQLQQMGLLDVDGRPTAVSFDLGVQMGGETASTTEGSHIVPDFITNELSPNIRKIFSNQLTKLPTQGAKCRIINVGAPSGGGDRVITFTSFGCESNTSIQGNTIRLTGDNTYSQIPALGANFFIWNVQYLSFRPNAVTGGPSIPDIVNNISYEIDKFELVLIQSSIDPQNRMPSPFIYSTWKLETATIETSQPTYARQFILEENVYNCFLLTPSWNDDLMSKGSLVSTKRGVSYYRYSVNQVNQTNRDVYLNTFRSSYPSTLYMDRLNDTFSNSDYILRSPVGIRGVQESTDAVICYPLKIYHAVSEQSYVMGAPGGATVQLNLFADTASNGRITAGNIFFFKQVLKQLM